MTTKNTNQTKTRKPKKGFTLIELVMVILLLAILAAVAIPNFIDLRTDARNSATHGALGAMRAAIAVATAAIALKEDPMKGAFPKYPTVLETQPNVFLDTEGHLVLSGTPILDPAQGTPKNPWTMSTLLTPDFNTILDCSALPLGPKADYQTTPGLDDRGWCYNATQGIIWANSKKNGGPIWEYTY